MSWRQYDTAISHFIKSSDEPDLQLHLRAHGDEKYRPPLLMVHGATYASRLFDIPYPGMSWLRFLAEAGFAAYAIDIRGYGKSHSQRRQGECTPYAVAAQAIADIDDAVGWLAQRHDADRVSMIGGSWGSVTSALFASTIGKDRVDRLVLYAPIYAARNEGWLRMLADPDDPGRLNRAFGAYRLMDEQQTRERWDEEIPSEANWRNEAVLQALFDSSLSDDPCSTSRDPSAFRVPNGTFVDLWEVFAHGRRRYDPAQIACPTLLLRGGGDLTSTRSDALALFDALGTRDKRYVEIADGGHFISAERRAGEVFRETADFLLNQATTAK